MIFIIFVLISALSFFYFVAMQIASPGTFLGTFFSFSVVWLLCAVFFAVLAVLQKKKLLRTIFFKIKRNVKIFLGVFVFLCAVICGVNLFFICNPRLSDGKEKVQYVILLGGGITKDAELTLSVQNRVRVAGEYLKKQPQAISVVTGGKGRFAPCPESDVLKPALESYGIEEKRVLAENMAKDTIENFLFSVKILSEHENKTVQEILNAPVAVVTSDFHLARAERLAKRIGFTDVYGVASKTPALFVLNSYSREICSYIKLNLRILFTGKPSLLK
ncbi:YdcF family protein [uncultured Treponema sp.]|uniref:YdcF family protein n=1 Tax=uncultured Treponema sp. TaxID=162155 RepID=UPI00280B0D7A|nr:YdcF family protein [uncultured Treponema sp.]